MEQIPDNFDEEFLTCPICIGLYENPKTLSCLHSFCSRCLEDVANCNGGSRFPCPVCRTEVELPRPSWAGGVDELGSDFNIKKLLEFRKLNHYSRSPVQCLVCKSGRKVSALCKDCGLSLCNRCVTVHRSDRAFQGHAIFSHDFENSSHKNTEQGAQGGKQIYCPQHKDQPLTFYCVSCTTLVCRDCTIDEHRPGDNHDPKEPYKVAAKYKESAEHLMEKTKAVISKVNHQIGNRSKGLTRTVENCKCVKEEIKQHYRRLRSKLEQEEEDMLAKVEKVMEDRKDELSFRTQEMEREVEKTKEGLAFCRNVLDHDDNIELLYRWQQMEARLKQLTSQETGIRTFGDYRAVSFHPSSLSLVLGSLLVHPWLDVEGPTVECLPCSIRVTADTPTDLTGKSCKPFIMVKVTSPQGKTTQIHTTTHSDPPLGAGKGQTSRDRRVWGAEWRPQEPGKHTLQVCMGDKKDLGSFTLDVASNNPVLRFGQKGMHNRQFDRPMGVAVRGDRMYVADTYNHRIQVLDQNGKFHYLFLPTTTCESGMARQALTGSLAVQTDGTIVVRSLMEVMKFSLEGKLLHRFFLSEFCKLPSGLAVQRDGRVVVADRGKHSIFLFEADGTLVKQVGGEGKGEGQFKRPLYLCVDKEDNIIVADKGNHRIQVFDKNLNFKHKFGQKGTQPQDMWDPVGVSADSRGNIVLANLGCTIDGIGQGEKLQVFRSNGTWVSTISSDGDKLNLPSGVAVTEDGHVFVTDAGAHCIRKYKYM